MTRPKPCRHPKSKRAKIGECCPLMVLVLGRRRESDRVGLMLENMFSLTGPTREAIVLRFQKAPRGDKTAYANTTFAMVDYCPFCGERIPLASKRGRGGRKR